MNKEKANHEKPAKRGMERSLGVFSVFSICTGAAFSSGFFLLPGMAADDSGPSLPLAYLAAGILMLPAVLSISELSAAMPRSGGPYFFVTRSFGPLLGMIGACGKFVQLILKGAFAFVGVGIYLSLLIEVPTETLAVILILVFTGINLLGVRQTATTEKIMVIILLIILTYFLVSGGAEIWREEQDLKNSFQPLLPNGWDGFITALALVFISFGGIAQVASVAEEVKKPARSFPRGILFSLAVSTFFYLSGTAIMLALVPPNSLQGDETPAASAVDQITSLPFPVTIIVIAALAAFASTGNAAILSASRYPYALAKDRLIWIKFGALTDKGIPKHGVLLTGALSIAFVLLLDVKDIAKIASAFLLFVFLSLCLAVIIFRESDKKEYQPAFRSPGYPWIQIIGCLVYTWLIYESGLVAIGFIAGVFVAGFLWYSYGTKRKPDMAPAIHNLLQKWVQKKTPQPNVSMGITMAQTAISTAVEHAIFMDLNEKFNFDEVIDKAAEALSNRLGGKKDKIASVLKQELRHWTNPVKYNISAAPALLHGIEQPEMIIVRGEINTEDRELDGLIVLVDDESSPNRLLQILSQLEIAINHPGFPEAWKEADGAAEIKRSLLIDVQAIYLKVREDNSTKTFIGTPLEELDLPEHCVVGAVYREGRIFNAGGDLKIEQGDELILIGRGRAFEKFSEKFGEGKI